MDHTKIDLEELNVLLKTDVLSNNTVAALSQQLMDNPATRICRLTLLSHYFIQQAISKTVRPERADLVKWFIENDPNSALLRFPQLSMDVCSTSAQTTSLVRCWMDKSEGNFLTDDGVTNASYFLAQLGRYDIAEQLLYNKLADSPNSLPLIQELLDTFAKQWHNCGNLEQGVILEKALLVFDKIDDLSVKYMVVEQLAELLLLAGQYEKAQEFAQILLAEAEMDGATWYSSLAIHQANILLGCVCLKENDLSSAKEFLQRASVQSSILSPQLASFGPNLKLAKLMLGAGEIDSVIDFLRACKEWWISGSECLNCWLDEIETSGTCSFKYTKNSLN